MCHDSSHHQASIVSHLPHLGEQAWFMSDANAYSAELEPLPAPPFGAPFEKRNCRRRRTTDPDHKAYTSSSCFPFGSRGWDDDSVKDSFDSFATSLRAPLARVWRAPADSD